MPLWQVTVYMKMLGPIQAGQQLLAIEASSVPHMKQDAATQVVARLRKRFARERRRSVAEQLMGAMKVQYVPKAKDDEGGE